MRIETPHPALRATFSHKGRREEHTMTSPDLPAELKFALDAKAIMLLQYVALHVFR